jgi:hypothetical protein
LAEVAGDLGIGVNALEAGIGKMNKTLGASPEKFAAIGAEIAKNKDGTTDVVKTFENVATALNNIPDPAKRAKAAADIFGKGWQSMAELVRQGGDGIAATLASVEKSKVFSPEKVAEARKFRDELDALHGVAESVALEVGGRVAKAVTDLIDLFEKGKAKVQQFADYIGDHVPDAVKKAVTEANKAASDGGPQAPKWNDNIVDAFKMQGHNIAQAGRDIGTIFNSAYHQINDIIHNRNEEVNASLADLGAGTVDVSKNFQNLIWASNQAAVAAKAQATAQAAERQSFVDTANALKTWADRQAEALQYAQEFGNATAGMDWGAAKLTGAVAGMSDFHAQFFGLADIASSTEAAFDGLGESLKKNGKSFDLNTEKGRNNQKAVEDLSSSLDSQLAAALADSGGSLDTFKGKAAQMADTLRSRLQNELHLSGAQADDLIARLGLMPADIETRYNLSGTEEAKVKIGLLQGAIDHLPKDVQAIVTQRVIAGDYVGAVQAIQNYNDNHPTTVRVNAVVGSTTAASSVLAAIRSPRNASGGDVAAGEATWVGDKYGINSPSAELFVPKVAGHIYNQSQIRRAAGGTPLSGGAVSVNYTVNVTAGMGANGAAIGSQIVQEIKKYERSNGAGWRR